MMLRREWARLLLLAAVTAVVLELLRFHGPVADGGWRAVLGALGTYAAAGWVGPLVWLAGRKAATPVAIGLLVVARAVLQPVPGAGPAAVAIGLGAMLLLARTLMVTGTAGGRLVPVGLALGGVGHAVLVAAVDVAAPGWAVTVAECAVLLVLLGFGSPRESRPIPGFAWARGTPHLALLGPYLGLAVPLTNPVATGVDRDVASSLVVGGWSAALVVVASLRVPTWSGWLPQPDILLSAAVLVGAVVVSGQLTGWPAAVAAVLAQVTLAVGLSRALAPRPLDVLPSGRSLPEMPYRRQATVSQRVGWAALGMGASYGLAATAYQVDPQLVEVLLAVLIAGSAVIRRPWKPNPRSTVPDP
ncbi:hypothetical protein WEI85_36120 [Actinomycetes bacterium KLBMP 9797]